MRADLVDAINALGSVSVFTLMDGQAVAEGGNVDHGLENAGLGEVEVRAGASEDGAHGLSEGVDNAQKAFRLLEGNAQAVTKSAERLSSTAEQTGKDIQATFAQVDRVQVTETISYDQGTDSPPVVTQSVSGGRLSLSDPACTHSDCNVDFDVTVPADVTVTASTGGGQVTVSGTAGANLASSGGPVRATRYHSVLRERTALGAPPVSIRGRALPGGRKARPWHPRSRTPVPDTDNCCAPPVRGPSSCPASWPGSARSTSFRRSC